MATETFDPRDFIGPPFKKCPKCGGHEFGILQIGGDLYTRRCRERQCRHTEPFPLPEIRKKVIYLDQFAVSDMMKALNPRAEGYKRATEDPFWLNLFESLDVVCKLQLVVCPYSDAHRNESLLSPFYQQLKRIYEHFSSGVSFYDLETIRRFQVSLVAEAWIRDEAPKFDFNPNGITYGQLHEWQDRIMISVNISYEDIIETLRDQRDKVHNEFVSVFAQWQAAKFSFDEIFKQEALEFGPRILRDFVIWRRQFTEAAKGAAPFNLEDVLAQPSFSLISAIRRVFSRAEVPNGEIWPNIIEFLRSETLVHAPYNRISATLLAVMAGKAASGQKEPPNRGTASDVNIVSTLLPYCDAMFIDNKCRALLDDIPKDHQLPYTTKVFSRNSDTEFLSYLKEIKDSASADHLELIKDVYDQDFLRPYTEIFSKEGPKPAQD